MSKGKVKDITFKGTVDTLKSCSLQNGKVPMVSIQCMYICIYIYNCGYAKELFSSKW